LYRAPRLSHCFLREDPYAIQLPLAKTLICKFVAKAAPVPDAAPSDDAFVANNVEDPPPAAVIDQAPEEEAAPPPLPQALKKSAPATPPAKKNLQGPSKG
jgi:hypothetical protein